MAGLATALLLHRDGHRVRLFERFETMRPIGSGLMLQPTGLAVLAALGLDGQAVAAGRRIERLFGRTADRIVLDVRYAALGGDHFGIGIHRAALFDILFKAVAAAGIPIETGRAVTGSRSTGRGRWLDFADAESAGPFDLLVDALGSRSPLTSANDRSLPYGALWASLDWPADGFDPAALEQRYRAASAMAGIMPIGTTPGSARPQAAFFWSLRADRLTQWQDAGLDAWKAEVAALWPAAATLTGQIDDPAQLTFAHYVHKTVAKPVEAALIHIGDAWHSTSPQLGQGANMALLDAFALAQGLREGGSVGEALDRAVGLRRSHVRLYQALSRVFTPVYQSDGQAMPWLRDRVVGPLSGLRPVAWLQALTVAGLVGSPLSRLKL